MAACGERAAHDGGGDHPRARRFAEHARGQRGAGRNADERLHDVPRGIHARDLVGEELDEAHESRRGEHQRMREHDESRRQVDPVQEARGRPAMNSTAYSRRPLAQPIAAASATSCQVSNDASALVMRYLPVRSSARDPRRATRLPRNARDAFLAFGRRANRRDALDGIGDHVRVDRPVRDGADERLAFALRGGSCEQQRPEDLVDAVVELRRAARCRARGRCDRPPRPRIARQ